MTGRMPGASSTKKSKALFSRGSESGKKRKHTNKQQPTVIITTKRDPAQKRQRPPAEGMRKVRETGTFLPGGTSMCKGAGARVCSTGDSNQRGLTGARVTIRQTLPFYRGEN